MTAVTSPRPARLVAAALLAVVLGAAALLVGCTPSNVVATVDGRVVLTTQQLARIQPGVLELIGEDQGAAAVISVVVTGEIAPSVAAANKVELTADQLKEIETESAKVTDPEARAVVHKFYTAYMVFQVLNQKDPSLWAAGVGKADVQVNPRYGSWTNVNGTWAVVDGGSLSQVSAQPTAQG